VAARLEVCWYILLRMNAKHLSTARAPSTAAARLARLKAQQSDLMPADTALKSGRFGDWVYFVRYGKQLRRRYVKPRDPRTPKQLRVRTALGAASKAYSWALTEAQREECRRAGAKIQSRPRLRQSGPLTGQLYHIARTTAQPGRAKTSGASKRRVRRSGR
jgi:hypothetical protein